MTDRFEAEGVCLILGDCRERDIPKEAAIISDPPYGMDWNTDTTRFSGGEQGVKRGKDWGSLIQGDAEPFDPSRWIAHEKCVLFGSNHYGNFCPLALRWFG